MASRQRIKSLYLDEREEKVVQAISLANGISVNGVIRNVVRSYFGMPAPVLAVPERVQAMIDELVRRAVPR